MGGEETLSGTERIKNEVRERCKAVVGLGREELSRNDTCIFMHKHTASSPLHRSLVSGSAQQKITNEILTALKTRLRLTLFYNIGDILTRTALHSHERPRLKLQVCVML